jgi:hypothetical protein
MCEAFLRCRTLERKSDKNEDKIEINTNMNPITMQAAMVGDLLVLGVAYVGYPAF